MTAFTEYLNEEYTKRITVRKEIVLKWECPHCGYILVSLYVPQLLNNIKYHVLWHKRKGTCVKKKGGDGKKNGAEGISVSGAY